ncbi:MAG: energy-dependent translational throttle protein EttA, partial [Acidimicrobiaceae bacterium]
MHKVGRYHPPDKDVLKDISLSFYPGAKIGVIGANGSGKSSLLRIMAGIDDGFTGEARLSPGFTVGLLEQEPHLDESKDVKANVMDGVAAVADLLRRYDEVLARYADPDADYDKIGEEQARIEAEMAAKGANDLERQI